MNTAPDGSRYVNPEAGSALTEEDVVFPGTPEALGSAQQSPAPMTGEPAPRADLVAPYLTHLDSNEARARWKLIQTAFVDDPRRSVADAHGLVSELFQRIVASFTAERAALEGQWSQGEAVSTEDLRVCLQRYRDFFTRLLPVTEEVRR